MFSATLMDCHCSELDNTAGLALQRWEEEEASIVQQAPKFGII